MIARGGLWFSMAGGDRNGPSRRHRSAGIDSGQAVWCLRRKRWPTARPAITLVHARIVAGSGAGTCPIVPAVGE